MHITFMVIHMFLGFFLFSMNIDGNERNPFSTMPRD